MVANRCGAMKRPVPGAAALLLHGLGASVEIVVPLGTEADVALPDGTAVVLASGEHQRTWAPWAGSSSATDGDDT
jgi:hypothetical protein